MKDNKAYKNGAPPEDECEAGDFRDFEAKVDIDSPSDGQTINSSSFAIKLKTDAPFGVKDLMLYINGDEKKSVSDSSLNYDYDASGDNGKSLTISAKVVDKKDNEDSTSIKVNVSF